jgi:polyhydroxyalkanoate synthesis repressor PhaR
MQIIKKYANRKLYHTNRKQYITLEGVAQLVSEGQRVRVLDNETGEDITAPILVQAILHTRKQREGGVPLSVLLGLVQAGGDALAGLRRSMLGMLGGQDYVEAEIQRRLDVLTEEGAFSTEEAARLHSLLLRHDLAGSLSDVDIPESILPGRGDIVRLHAQIDALAAAVEQLSQQHDKQTSHSEL